MIQDLPTKSGNRRTSLFLSERAAWLVALLLLVAAATVAFMYQFRWPFRDELDVIFLLVNLDDGSLSVRDFFHLHAHSHWHAPSRLVLLALAVATDWNASWETGVNLLVTTILAVILMVRLRDVSRRVGVQSLRPLVVVLSAMVLFSWNQTENWIWGWQLAVFLNLLGAAIVIVVLTGPTLGTGRIAAALFMAAFAAYNMTHGILCFPVAIGLIAIHPSLDRRTRIASGVVFVLAGCAISAHFLSCLPEEAASAWVLAPRAQLCFAATYLGSPVGRIFGHHTEWFGLLGLAVAVGTMVWLRCRARVPWAALAPFLALVVYAAGSAWMSAVGRSAGGHGLGRSYRYLTFSNLLWLADFLLMAFVLVLARSRTLSRPARLWWRCLTLLGILLIGLFVWNSLRAAGRAGRTAGIHNRMMDDVLATYPHVDPRHLRDMYPQPEQARAYLEYMHRKRLSLFSGP